MKNLICCDREVNPVRNTKELWRYRDEGFSEDDAQELSIVCFLCEHCRTVYEENDNGKMFVIHLPTGKVID